MEECTRRFIITDVLDRKLKFWSETLLMKSWMTSGKLVGHFIRVFDSGVTHVVLRCPTEACRATVRNTLTKWRSSV